MSGGMPSGFMIWMASIKAKYRRNVPETGRMVDGLDCWTAHCLLLKGTS